MTIEGGKPATNKKIVEVQFSSLLTTQEFAKVRFSLTPEMTETKNPWRDFSSSTTYDFAEEYDKDGKKDGLKTLYAELLPSYRDSQPLKLAATIGLDTIVPTVSAQEILAKGLQGVVYKKGQSVALKWAYQDAVAPTGYSSGLDPHGMRVGYTSFADCSNQVTWVTDWQQTSSGINFSWPTSAPLDTFYVCVLMKDLAGNQYAMLSQPMISLWRVFAGDNSQGNGGSVKASNVRLAYPGTLATDSKLNLFILDGHFNNIRRVSKDGQISLVIGTGPAASPTAGKALNTNIAVSTAASLAVDSKDRVYFLSSNGSLYRLIPQQDETYNVEVVMTGLCSSSHFDVAKKSNGDLLYLHHWCSQDPSVSETTALNYLLKIPVVDLDARTKALSRTDALATYKILGNGRGLKRTDPIPAEIKLGKNDPAGDPSYSLGASSAVMASSTGAIYISTYQDGSGRGWDHHSIRRLTDNGDGTWKQERLIDSQLSWIYNLTETDMDPTTGRPKLVISTVNSFYVVDPVVLAGKTYANYTRFGDYTNGIFGVVSIKPIGSERLYFGSIGSSAKIAIFNSAFTEIGSYGRAAYSENDKIATEAMLNQPEGIVQTAKGNTYFLDVLNNLVRKVDSSGQISTVAGQVNKTATPVYDRADLSSFTYNGFTYVNGTYYSGLDGEYIAAEDREVLYAANGGVGKINRLDLKDHKVTTVAGHKGADGTAEDRYNKIYTWATAGLAIGRDPAGNKALVIARSYENANPRFNGGLTSVTLNGDQAPVAENEALVFGNKDKDVRQVSAEGTLAYIKHGDSVFENPIYMALQVRQDSAGYVYTAGPSGFQVFKPGSGSKTNVIAADNAARFSAGPFVIYEEGTKRDIFGIRGNRLFYFSIDIKDLNGPSSLTPTVQYLCLPGSFWNTPRAMTTTVGKNLLVSDGSSGRIVEYFLRDSAGKLALSICP